MFKRNEMEIGYWNVGGRWMTESGDSKRPDFGFLIEEGKVECFKSALELFLHQQGANKMYEQTNK